MKPIVISCLLLISTVLFAAEPSVNLPNRGVLGKSRAIFDPSISYSDQQARVTDYDDSKTIYKLHFENNNIKFLKTGDSLKFRVLGKKSDNCQGQVRSIENFYVTLEVASLEPCWDNIEYFRRGTVLYVSMPIMEKRIYEAVNFRKLLVNQRVDFFNQLKDINNFLYNYDQEKVKLIVEYDERMAKLMEEKKKSIRALLAKRKESYSLRHQLTKKLDHVDRDLKFYRIERQEALVDRWDLSHDLGKPVGTRPKKSL